MKPVVAVAFTIEKAETQKDLYPNLFQRLIQEFKLTEKQAKMVLKSYSVGDINKKLYDISLSKTQIANMGAYVAKSFNV